MLGKGIVAELRSMHERSSKKAQQLLSLRTGATEAEPKESFLMLMGNLIKLAETSTPLEIDELMPDIKVAVSHVVEIMRKHKNLGARDAFTTLISSDANWSTADAKTSAAAAKLTNSFSRCSKLWEDARRSIQLIGTAASVDMTEEEASHSFYARIWPTHANDLKQLDYQ